LTLGARKERVGCFESVVVKVGNVKVEAEVGKPVLVVVVAAGVVVVVVVVEVVDAGDGAVTPRPNPKPKPLVLPLAKFEKDMGSPGFVVVLVDNGFIEDD